jgi:hypothetical protein
VDELRGVDIVGRIGKVLVTAGALVTHGPCRGANARTYNGDIVWPNDEDAWYFDPSGALYYATHDQPIIVLDVSGRLLCSAAGGNVHMNPWRYLHDWADTARDFEVRTAFGIAYQSTVEGRGRHAVTGRLFGRGETIDAAIRRHREELKELITSRQEC